MPPGYVSANEAADFLGVDATWLQVLTPLYGIAVLHQRDGIIYRCADLLLVKSSRSR